MRKIVIAGATSFIGKALIKSLFDRKYDIIAIVRKNSKKIKEIPYNDKINILELNLNEYHKMGQEVGSVDCYISLAWNGTRGNERNNEILQNENYTYNLQGFESMLKVGSLCLISVGSQAEYGNVLGKIKEDTKCTPNTEYGKAKLKLYRELKILTERYGVRYLEPRIFSIYGLGDFENTLIMNLIDKMQKNEDCNLTECTQKWNFLYVEDAANAIISLYESNCPSGIYNLASEDTRYLKNFVEEIHKLLGSDSVLNYGAIESPATGIVSIDPDITKLLKNTDWKPKIKFSEGIKVMLNKDM